MQRIPEPELMLDPQQAKAYAEADFEAPHNHFITLFQETFPAFNPTGQILDLGCGPGDISVRFAKAFPDCTIDGIDGAQAMLEAGQPLLEAAGVSTRVRLSHACLPDDSPPREHYDGVISNSLLHHLHQPAILWNAIKRYTKPDGFIFIMDLMRPQTPEMALQMVNTYASNEPEILQRDFYHSLLAAFSLDEIKDQLAQAGLSFLATQAVSDRHLIVYGSYRA